MQNSRVGAGDAPDLPFQSKPFAFLARAQGSFPCWAREADCACRTPKHPLRPPPPLAPEEDPRRPSPPGKGPLRSSPGLGKGRGGGGKRP